MKSVLVMLLLTMLFLSGCTKTVPEETAKTDNAGQISVLSAGLNANQKRRAEQLISLFENGTLVLQYGYAERLHDGRGITCGRAGFTTGTGDAYEVVKLYTDEVPGNKLAKYLPELKRLLTARNKDDVSRLSGFIRDWSSLGNNAVFRSVQDRVVDDMYYKPSERYSNNLNLATPLARAVIYDTIIQHGDGDDPDGLRSLINRTNQAMGGSPKQGIDEKKWLAKFLDVRRADLQHPADRSSQDVWAQSVGRVDVFKYIAAKGNYRLDGPIRIRTRDYNVTIP
ncbi:chitosanase [Paenibacillus hamazuiensis]|uniref:chitosanase n=1 Tax=Paenibacillus hamazuiensis TaxID=2936508 RepID=UPI0023DFA312|nr:chitosanase [Paenibacillus hamazuiensis]